jgi:hypothetical protein
LARAENTHYGEFWDERVAASVALPARTLGLWQTAVCFVPLWPRWSCCRGSLEADVLALEEMIVQTKKFIYQALND